MAGDKPGARDSRPRDPRIDGSAYFTGGQEFPASEVIGIGDVDGDGTRDLALKEEGCLKLARGLGDGTFRAPETLLNFSRFTAFRPYLADYDDDGDLDCEAPLRSGPARSPAPPQRWKIGRYP